jgi:hypothetical protein
MHIGFRWESQKRPIERPRCRWEDNIKMDLKRNMMGWCGMVLPGSVWGPVEGSCEHGSECVGRV